jgi:hypothetical protein
MANEAPIREEELVRFAVVARHPASAPVKRTVPLSGMPLDNSLIKGYFYRTIDIRL